jgi:hypothetical protein
MASRVAEFEWILRDPEASADLVREAMTSRMPLQLTPGGVMEAESSRQSKG